MLKPITTYPDDAIAIPSLPSVTKVPLSNVHTIATWKPKKLPTPTTYPSQPKSVPTWKPKKLPTPTTYPNLPKSLPTPTYPTNKPKSLPTPTYHSKLKSVSPTFPSKPRKILPPPDIEHVSLGGKIFKIIF